MVTPNDVRRVRKIIDSNEKVPKEMDYNFILLRHIERVALLGSYNDQRLVGAVETLYFLLVPYFDSKFKLHLSEMRMQYNEIVSSLKPETRGRFLSSLNYKYSLALFSKLLELMKRKGMLPALSFIDYIK